MGHEKIIAPEHRSQHGNVLFLILIAVALFAALSYAVSVSMRNGGGSAANEKTETEVASVLQYFTGMRQAIDRMRLNGCDDAQISFERTGSTAYTNPNSPADKRCHVFSPNGGGISYRNYGGVATSVVVDGIGTSKSDLTYYVHNIGSDFCDKLITQLYGANTSIGETVPGTGYFKGDYGDPKSISIGDTSDAFFKGKPIGCFSDTSAMKNKHFYYVLLER